MWPGADNAHMTDQYIQELGNFVEVGVTKKSSHPGDPGVIIRGLFCIGLGVVIHGPEFKTGKGAPKKAYAFLDEKNGPFGVQLDQKP
jgi:hypothetical protein